MSDSTPDQPDSETSSLDLVQRVRDGDQDAAAQLYARYIERIIRVVGGNLSSTMQARIEPEDVVQSVFRSVFRRMQRGDYEFEDDGDFWRLLVTVALNKTRKQQKRHSAKRRNVKRDARMETAALDAALAEQLSAQPSISDVVAFRDTIERLLDSLDEDSQRVVHCLLEGYKQQEIADQLGVSDRTVRRKLSVIREIVEGQLENDIDDPPASD